MRPRLPREKNRTVPALVRLRRVVPKAVNGRVDEAARGRVAEAKCTL